MTTPRLRIPRGVAEGEAEAPDISPIEHVAMVAAQEVENLRGQLASLAAKNKELREQLSEYQGRESVWALTEGGMTLFRTSEILEEVRAVRKMLEDRWGARSPDGASAARKVQSYGPDDPSALFVLLSAATILEQTGNRVSLRFSRYGDPATGTMAAIDLCVED